MRDASVLRATIGPRVKTSERKLALFRKTRRAIKRLLIVEDEPLVAFDNEYLLSQAGYQVVATIDRGEAALPYLSAELVDAIVLDVGLAGEISGIEVARLASERSIPVLFATGQCPAEARAYAYGCLAKPYSAASLMGALATMDAMVQGNAPVDVPSGLTLFRQVIA